MSAGRFAIPGDVHLALVQDVGLGEDLAKEVLNAKMPRPKARLPTRHRVVAVDLHRLPHVPYGRVVLKSFTKSILKDFMKDFT